MPAQEGMRVLHEPLSLLPPDQRYYWNFNPETKVQCKKLFAASASVFSKKIKKY
jgi:hypothetical protein